MRAIEGFDAAAGVRFSTYAAYWVKQSLRSALMKHGRLVRLPAYTYTLLTKWRRASAVLADRLGREPTPQEVGGALGLTPKKLRVALEALHASQLTPAPEEFDGPESGTPLDRLPTPGLGHEEVAAQREAQGRVLDRLGRLEAREATVVRLRFGLGVDRPRTLSEVGEQLGLTRERIRQLEKRALAALAAS
jgi:RNA polymerase primary sigma factor